MPPAARLSREAMVEVAFELTRERGWERLSARGLAQALDCSTQPIFTCFGDMDGLKRAVYERAREFFAVEMARPILGEPPFLAMGLNYVMLARRERNLFKLLCMSDSLKLSSLYELGGGALPEADARLFARVWIFAHGVAVITAFNDVSAPPSEIKELLLTAYGAFNTIGEVSP